jgi:signal peptidase I
MGNILKIIGGWFLDMIETAVFALSIFVLVYVFLAQPHQVSGNSMFPNFHTGEYLLTNKLAYRLGLPRRGEVIVFKAPSGAHCPTGGACDFIKRIIGEPGERVSLRAGKFYVNGQVLAEPYLAADLTTPADAYLNEGREIVLAENEYFVAGDNRLGSSDSRAWGPIKAGSIVGRAWIRYWPLSELGLVPNYFPVNAR